VSGVGIPPPAGMVYAFHIPLMLVDTRMFLASGDHDAPANDALA